MTWAPNSEIKAVEALPGVFRKTMTVTASMMLCEITLKAGSGVDLHQHMHEQIGYVVRGQIRMIIGEEERVLSPGDSYSIPGGVPHGGWPVDGDCTVVDIFSPHREDYR